MASRAKGPSLRRCGPLAVRLACGVLAASVVPPAAVGLEQAGTTGSFLMVPRERLQAIRAAAASGSSAWTALKANVDGSLKQAGLGDTSAMNVAIVYLVTGKRSYCDRLAAEAQEVMKSANPRGDSYAVYAGIMEVLAVTLGYCAPLLDGSLRGAIAGYLDRWTDELWFHNQGSGWGLKDPGNNYHVSFLLGTAWAGLALRAVGHPNAQKYVDIATRGIQEEIAYLDERCPGGGWIEGTNYGGGAKGRLADLLSLVAAAGITNGFRASGFFPAALRYAHYLLQPGNVYLYPAGDMARVSDMAASPYDRLFVQQVVHWLADSEERAVGQWYLKHVVPNYRTGFKYPQALWRDLVFGLDIPAKPQGSLPLGYWARGDNFVSMRSGWDKNATALMVSGASNIDQSHAHLDTGGFTLWRNGWQLVDAVTYSHSGLLQEPGAHNLIHVAGARRVAVKPRGVLRFVDGPRASYLQIDGTGLHAKGDSRLAKNLLLREFTREMVFLKPDTVLVYDRVQPAAPGTAFDWRLHFPSRPTVTGGTIQATHEGGGVAVALLVGDPPGVFPDIDLAPDGSKSWRAQATTRTGRFLAAVRVAAKSAPPNPAAIVVAGPMEGVDLGDDVVLFSRLPFGQAPGPGFSYTVPTVAGRTHTLVNMEGSVGIAVTHQAGNTVVTVTKGSDYTASPEGLIRFTERPPR